MPLPTVETLKAMSCEEWRAYIEAHLGGHVALRDDRDPDCAAADWFKRPTHDARDYRSSFLKPEVIALVGLPLPPEEPWIAEGVAAYREQVGLPPEQLPITRKKAVVIRDAEEVEVRAGMPPHHIVAINQALADYDLKRQDLWASDLFDWHELKVDEVGQAQP